VCVCVCVFSLKESKEMETKSYLEIVEKSGAVVGRRDIVAEADGQLMISSILDMEQRASGNAGAQRPHNEHSRPIGHFNSLDSIFCCCVSPPTNNSR